MYREAIALAPHDPEIIADQGYSFYLQNRYAEAEKSLKRALELNEDLPRARNNLAMVLARSEKLDDSFAEFRRAGSDITDAHVNLAYVMMWKGDLQGAQEEFEMALDIDDACVEAMQGLDRLKSLASRTDGSRQARVAPPRQPVASEPVSPEVEGVAKEIAPAAEVVQYVSEWPRRAAY